MLSLRTKLALLYAGAFFFAGAVLVTVGFLGFKQTARVGTPGPPAGQDNWINSHLVYTHGFGFVAAASRYCAVCSSPASFTV